MTDLINQIRDFILSDSQLSQKMEQVRLTDGQVLFEQGDREPALYLIKSGQIRIYTCDRNGREITLNTLGADQTLGELALIEDQPHLVTAVSLGSANLLRLNRHDFLQRAYNSAELSQLLIQLGNQRLYFVIDYIKKIEAWIGLVANNKCDLIIEDLKDFDIQGDKLVTSGYLASVLTTATDSFKEIVQNLQQLKRQDCKFRNECLSNVKFKLEIDRHQHQQQVDKIVNTEYFTYLVELAERRNNTVNDTEKYRENKDKVLPFNQLEIKRNSKVNSLQNPEIKQTLIRGLKNRSKVFNRLILKAWEDEKFKQELLANPRAVYIKKFGYKVPDNLTFEVVEETLDAIKIVLPINPFLKISEEELSEEILDAIAGGNWNLTNQDTFNNLDYEE